VISTGCRGAINGLVADVIEGHILAYIVDLNQEPTSERAKAAQELIDIV
jgi:FrmR/RcnR family transcriptional regulator, repressor of frmRAB operon